MRRPWLIPVAIIVAVFALVVYGALARFVLEGEVTASSLHGSVEGAADSAGSLLDGGGRCRSDGPPRTWRCGVYDSQGSGVVTYRVVVRPDSSCWDGRLSGTSGEGAPERISGCVRAW